MSEYTHTHASRCPTFLLITIIASFIGFSSTRSIIISISHAKKPRRRDARQADRQAGEVIVMAFNRKKRRKPPKGLRSLEVARQFKVIRAVVVMSIDIESPVTGLVYLEVVHISYTARYSGFKVVFFFGITLVTAIP